MKKRISAIILAAVQVCTMLVLFAVSVNAQYASYTIYVDGHKLSSSDSGISFSGDTVYLTNYNGGAIAAIENGTPDPYENEDYPDLKIVLTGTNTVSYGGFSQGSAYSKTETGAA